MADDDIRYDLLTQEALRGVIRKVLGLVQRSGLPGQHHLYIAFDTGAEGVFVSKRLKEQYPEEMTIVLQYQFWDLQVANDRFEVKLSFGSVPERLVVPYQAIKAFYDPSAQFGLQFGKQGAANDVARQHMASALPDLVADSDDGGHEQRNEPRAEPAPLAKPQVDPAAASPPESERARPGAEVVQLDRFRKK
jgi:uncharacterized protein